MWVATKGLLIIVYSNSTRNKKYFKQNYEKFIFVRNKSKLHNALCWFLLKTLLTLTIRNANILSLQYFSDMSFVSCKMSVIFVLHWKRSLTWTMQ